MKNPTKKQFQIVIDRLTAVLPFAQKDEQLDMMQTAVNEYYHKCGTVHCVGGWYQAYDYLVKKLKITKDYISFTEGSDAMAQDLGFSSRWGFSNWASENPNIWGNKRGRGLFCSRQAYGDANNLSEVVEWFKGVQSRLPKRAKK